MPKKLEDRDVSVKELYHLMQTHPDIDWRKYIELIIRHKKNPRKEEDIQWMIAAHRHAVETGWDEAHELFKF